MKSTPLAVLLLVCVTVLAVALFVFSGSVLHVCARILVFVVLVVGFDLILGYTGIVNFAHVVFFGIGAYGVALASQLGAPSPGWIILGLIGALLISLLLSALMGLLALRVKAIHFCMITLAITGAALTLVAQLSEVTGGEDGFSFKILASLAASRTTVYYILFLIAAGMFILLLRLVNSPFGRVLQAIRDNELRAEAMGLQDRCIQDRRDRHRKPGSNRVRRHACAAAALRWPRYQCAWKS